MTELAPAGIDLDAQLMAWVLAIRSADAEIARLTGIRGRAIEHLQAAMGDAEQALYQGQPVVRWAWSKPGQRLDRAALEADLGADVVAKYLRDNKPARPFKLISAEER